MAEPFGLLLATMEPASISEEEFHDWYDTEHLPERAGIEGFLTARRFVCIQGWPRYVAMYDMRYLGVLKEPGYVALSGTKFSPWSKRVLAGVHGQFRAEGVQIYPGDATFAAKGEPARMVMLRFRPKDRSQEDAIVAAAKATFGGRRDVLQLRIWRSEYDNDLRYLVAAEGTISLGLDNIDMSLLGDMERYADMANLYVPYWRRGALHGVFA